MSWFKNLLSKIELSIKAGLKKAEIDFTGVKESVEVPYNQLHLEKAVTGMKDNVPDYCFVWCLCNYYNLYENIPWNKIVEALKQAPKDCFDKVGGSVLNINKLCKFIAEKVNAEYRVIFGYKLDKKDFGDEKITTKEANRLLNKHRDSVFLMKRYYKRAPHIQHYTYVTLDGTELHPYPNLTDKWKFYGWRIFKRIKM